MATFYLLPPRPLLGEQLGGFLAGLFPGLDWGAALRSGLVESLGEAAARHEGVYVVFREELPDGEDLARALIDGFGAEAGDEVVEVRAGAARRWRVGEAGVMA
jgi:hypothetical protein